MSFRTFIAAALLAPFVIDVPARAQGPETYRILSTTMIAREDDDARADFEISQDRNAPKVLTFDLPQLPAGCVTGSQLRIVSDGGNARQVSIEVSLQSEAGETQAYDEVGLNRTDAKEGTPVTFYAGEIPDWLRPVGANEPQSINALMVALPTNPESEPREWHSVAADRAETRPRLTLEIAVPGPREAGVAALPGSYSPVAFLTDPPPAGAGWLRRMPMVASAVHSTAPILDGGVLYAVIAADGELQLEAISMPSGRTLASLPMPDAGQGLALSGSGRLYVFGGDTFAAVDVSLSGDPVLRFATGAGGAPLELDPAISRLVPIQPPVAGPDGSLYVVADVPARGTEGGTARALVGIGPTLQELWRVTLTGQQISTPALAPDGGTVYVATERNGLLAVNTATGEHVGASFEASALDRVDTLRMPVVLTDQDGSAVIYAAASAGTETGELARFTHAAPELAQGLGTLDRAWSIPGIWGQPLPLHPERLEGAATEAPVFALKADGGRVQLTRVEADGSDPKSLGPEFASGIETRPVMDRTGVVYLWDGVDAQLRAVPVAGGAEEVAPAAVASSPKSRPLFGGDGTLILVDPGSKSLAALVPQGTDVAEDLLSPANLALAGTIGPQVTVTASGSILIGQTGAATSLQHDTTIRLAPRTSRRVVAAPSPGFEAETETCEALLNAARQ